MKRLLFIIREPFQSWLGETWMGIQVRQAQAVRNSCKRHILPWCLTLLCQENSAGKDNSTWTVWQTRNRVLQNETDADIALSGLWIWRNLPPLATSICLFLSLKSWIPGCLCSGLAGWHFLIELELVLGDRIGLFWPKVPECPSPRWAPTGWLNPRRDGAEMLSDAQLPPQGTPSCSPVPCGPLSIRAWNHSSPPYLSLNILPLVPLGKRFDQPLNVEAPAIDSVSLLLVCLHLNRGRFLLLLLFNVILLLCGMRTLRCFVWGLVPGPGMEPGPHALREWSLSHWTVNPTDGFSHWLAFGGLWFSAHTWGLGGSKSLWGWTPFLGDSCLFSL